MKQTLKAGSEYAYFPFCLMLRISLTLLFVCLLIFIFVYLLFCLFIYCLFVQCYIACRTTDTSLCIPLNILNGVAKQGVDFNEI